MFSCVCFKCCVTFTESEPYCHSVLFVCLSGCLSVIPRPTAYHDWSITTKFLSAGIYLSSDPCKPFWIPYLPYFRCQREKYATFRLFPSERDALCHMTCKMLMLVWLNKMLWCCWLGVRKGIQPAKIEWSGAGLLICLEWGTSDLHMIQLMPVLHHLLHISGAGLPRLFWKTGPLKGCGFC